MAMEAYQVRALSEALGTCVDLFTEILTKNYGITDLDEGYGSPGQFSLTSPGKKSTLTSVDPMRIMSAVISCKYCLETLSNAHPKSLVQKTRVIQKIPGAPLSKPSQPKPTRLNQVIKKKTTVLPSAAIQTILGYLMESFKKKLVYDEGREEIQSEVCRKQQRALYACLFVSKSWNEAASILLWGNPFLASRIMVSKFILCARVTGVRLAATSPTATPKSAVYSPSSPSRNKPSGDSEQGSTFNPNIPLLSWHTLRLDFTFAKLRDPTDVGLFCSVLTVCPNLEVLKWGANPMSESTLYQLFKRSKSVNALSVVGPILSAKTGAPSSPMRSIINSTDVLSAIKDTTSYLEVIQEGLGRLKILELLDVDDDIIVETPKPVESPDTLARIQQMVSSPSEMDPSNAFIDSTPSHLKKNRMSMALGRAPVLNQEETTSKRDKRQSNVFALMGNPLSSIVTPTTDAESKLEGTATSKRDKRQSSMFSLGSIQALEADVKIETSSSKRDKRQSNIFGLGGSTPSLYGNMTTSLKRSIPDQLHIASITASNSEVVRKAVEEQMEKLKIANVSSNSPVDSMSALLSPQPVAVRDIPRLLRSSLSPVLETLILSGNVTTDLVVNIARRTSPGVVHAILTDCSQLEDRAAILLAANSGTSLRMISLRGCTSITDSAVGEIVSWCPILEVLDLTRTRLTDMGLWAINSKCAIRETEADSPKKAMASHDKLSMSFRGLKALYLDYTQVCADGGQAMISFITRGGARLQDLSLLNCTQMSDECAAELIDALIQYAPHLKRLDARNTITPSKRICEKAIERLMTERHLDTLNVGGIGLELTEFVERLSSLLPNEGCQMEVLQW